MSEQNTQAVTIPDKLKNIADQLNSNVFAVIGGEQMDGFHKAYQIATATDQIKSLLSADYMKPIMALQGNKLGFKTDRDDKGGYSMDIVKNCLIEAVLTGVQPFGNQFNIIAGNMYVTKEGFGQLLKKVKGLKYKIIPGLPRVSADKKSAAVTVSIKYTFNGESSEEEIEIPIRSNEFMGVDGILGKATRKARAWLFNTITNSEIADGDVVDLTAEVISSKIERKESKEEAVTKSMASIAKEVKAPVVPAGDPSQLSPEEQAGYTK